VFARLVQPGETFQISDAREVSIRSGDAGAVVVSVDYRLAPLHRFPTAVQDSLAAVTWVAEHAGELDADGGRMAVMEVLTANADTERLIAEGATADAIAESARTAGMKTLWDSGIEHVRAGETSLDELLRVVEPPTEIPVRRPQPRRDNGGEPTGNRSDDRGRGPSQTPSRNGVTKPASLPDEALQLLDDLFDETFNARKTVLLVEDEEPLRRVLRDLLEREGFTVVEAADGVQALDEVDRSAPDVLVLDLNLPRLDGYGVLSHLRARPSTAKLPVIVLTAKGDEDNEVRVFETGANDFLTKPFRPRALSARLRALLKMKAV